MTIEWDNGKCVTIGEDERQHPDFWALLQVLLDDANKEGGIVALRSAAHQAQQTIDAMKRNKPRILGV